MSTKALLRYSAHVDGMMERLRMSKPVEWKSTFKVGEITVNVGKRFGEGDLCNLFDVTYEVPATEHHDVGGSRFDRILDDEDGSSTAGVLKVCADPIDNDLVENEGKILTEIYPPKVKDEKFFRYLPKPLAAFNVKVGSDVLAAVLLPHLTNYVSVAEVLAAYPKGVPSWEDAVWMLNRVMEGLGFVHSKNVVHGALVPEHVMLHPTGHGAKLIDWSYATKCDDRSEARITAMVRARAEYYPFEILNRERVSPATDMFFVGKLGIALMGGDVKTNLMPASVPATVQRFLLDCVEPQRSKRTGNAWDARDEFEKVVVGIVGKRKYRPFSMPAK